MYGVDAMLKPRPLPPVHKNQLYVPVKSFGFFSEDHHHTPVFFRNHEIIKKRLHKLKPAGVFAPPNHFAPDQQVDSAAHRDVTPPNKDNMTSSRSTMTSSKTSTTSSKHSMTSLIRVKRLGSTAIDVSDVALKVEEDTPRKTPMSDKDDLKVVSFLTEDPSSSRSYGGRSSAVFFPVLECSKYNIIGEPRFRKKRVKRSEWTLPRVGGGGGGGGRLQRSSDTAGHHLKANVLDLKSIYSSDSKLHQVPPAEVRREDSVVLPPLEVGRRREEAESSVDAGSLAEKRLVMMSNNNNNNSKSSQRYQNLYRRMVKDQVVMPSSYKPYFRYKQRKHKFVRSLFGPNDMWENNRAPVHCSRCIHQSRATLHYCDVLGKRFCRFCSEMTERNFSRAYEGNRLLVASPHKSPTLLMPKEPSFIGVRKIVITKTTKQGQGQGQGGDLEESFG